MKRKLIVLIACLFLLLMSFPLITISENIISNLPLQLFYILALWLLVICVLSYIINKKEIKE
jgi:4-amino-4-deoxy-L-arabinose transferase-like glycosyltransferase